MKLALIHQVSMYYVMNGQGHDKVNPQWPGHGNRASLIGQILNKAIYNVSELFIRHLILRLSSMWVVSNTQLRLLSLLTPAFPQFIIGQMLSWWAENSVIG